METICMGMEMALIPMEIPIGGCLVWLMFWLEKKMLFLSKSNIIHHMMMNDIFSVVCVVQ